MIDEVRASNIVVAAHLRRYGRAILISVGEGSSSTAAPLLLELDDDGKVRSMKISVNRHNDDDATSYDSGNSSDANDTAA